MTAEGILGRKLGMTQVFEDTGEARRRDGHRGRPDVVVQVKTQKTDGYEAIQVGFGTRKRVNSPQKGHMKDLGQFRYLREISVDDIGNWEVGQKVGCEIFEAGDLVDVSGVTKGRGFAGGRQAPRLPRRPQDARPVRPPPGARLHRRRHHPGPCHQGHEDGRPHGHRQRDRQEPEGRADRPGRGIIIVRGAVPGNEGVLVKVRKSPRGKAKK